MTVRILCSSGRTLLASMTGNCSLIHGIHASLNDCNAMHSQINMDRMLPPGVCGFCARSRYRSLCLDRTSKQCGSLQRLQRVRLAIDSPQNFPVLYPHGLTSRVHLSQKARGCTSHCRTIFKSILLKKDAPSIHIFISHDILSIQFMHLSIHASCLCLVRAIPAHVRPLQFSSLPSSHS